MSSAALWDMSDSDIKKALFIEKFKFIVTCIELYGQERRDRVGFVKQLFVLMDLDRFWMGDSQLTTFASVAMQKLMEFSSVDDIEESLFFTTLLRNFRNEMITRLPHFQTH